MPETDTALLERPGTIVPAGAIDCDVHPRSPTQADLLPFVDAYWRDMLPYRDIDHLELMSYPVSTRPYRREGMTAESPEALARHLLDPMQTGAAILNLVNGVQAVYDPYMQAALCSATNRWLASEWLDRDPRLRASLLVPFRHVEAAAEEIRRYRDDHRFVQVLAISMGDRLLGQRDCWPIWKAAAECGMALTILPGSGHRHASTQAGWLTSQVEERVHWTQGFANQCLSLLSEGVLTEFPEMKVVLAESGVSWILGMTWRVAKDWRGARVEVPWIKESPEKIIERQIRMTVRPFDIAPGAGPALLDCIGGPGKLLWASDFPHAHDGAPGAWPEGLPPEHAETICLATARETYPRLEVTP